MVDGAPNLFRLRALLLPVYVPTFLLAITSGILIPTLPIHLHSLDVSFSLIGLAIGAAGLGTIAMDLPAGIVLGIFGRKRVMVAGAATVGLATLALGFTSLYPLIAILRLVGGIGTALWGISRLSYLADVVPIGARGRAISAFGGVGRIGMFVGPALGGLIGRQLGLEAAFIVAGMLDIAAALVTAIWVHEPSSAVKRVSPNAHIHHVGELIRTNLHSLTTAGAAQLLGQMIRAGRHVLIPMYGATVIGLDVAAVGAIVSISSAIDMSLFVPAGMVMDRFGRKFTSVPSFLIMAVGMAMLPFTDDYVGLLAATAILGFGNGLGSGAMMTLGADLAPRGSSGQFLGIWRVIGDTGNAGGPLVVGNLADLLGLSFGAWILAGVGLAAGCTIVFLVPETLRKRDAPVRLAED